MRKRQRFWQHSVQYGYVRSRQLEGTMSLGKRQGVYLISAKRIGDGWGMVSELRWPYDTKYWPPIPPVPDAELDRIASYNRSENYFAIRTVEDAKMILSQGYPFQLTIPITSAWRNAPLGRIPVTLSISPANVTEIHCVAICGYDDSNREFIFRNSWGRAWGDEGYGHLPYSYFRHSIEAWSDVFSHRDYPISGLPAIAVATFHSTNILGNYAASFVAVDDMSGEKVGWCYATVRDEYLDVEEFFVKPSRFKPRHAIELARALIFEQRILGLPFRFWISHCDWPAKSYNHIVSVNVASGLGLTIKKSTQRWAAAVAE